MDGGNFILTLLEKVAPEGVPGWVLALTAAGVGIGILVGFIAVFVMVAVWLERKISGHIQCRYGPMYAGAWHGWAQSLADTVKLLAKEDLIPLGSDKPLFLLAPALMIAAIFGALATVPFSPGVYFTNLNLGLFAILAMSSMTTIGVVMAGWASNSKWALYGSMREAAQVVAYEIPLGISLLVPLMVVGTFHLGEASAAQAGWYGMRWVLFRNPFVLPAFILFFTAALAETKRAPFDLPEAESELVAGFMTEYSGLRWSFFFMEEYAAMFLFSVVAAVFFLGGFESPLTHLARQSFGAHHVVTEIVAGATLMIKAMFGIFLMMWLRWTLPRVRIDQVMSMGYKYLTPLALVCVLGAGIWEAIF